MLRLEEYMEEPDSRLLEYFNTVSQKYQGLFKNLYKIQSIVLDTMNNTSGDLITKIENSV